MSEAQLKELGQELKRELFGEIRLDAASRKLYSTDASIYQIEPLGVVFPRDEDDLAATVMLAAQHGVPILPRGSGTSLAGQSVGAALVIDCSRYLNQILEINTEEGYALVQPGVVLDRFNRQAAPGYKYGPDPASEDRASFGGMLGNNSTGAHSILFGMTSDNVLALDVVLADGSLARLEAMDEREAARRAMLDSLEGRLYAGALSIRREFEEAIRNHWPRTWRRASGYSLNYLLPWAPSQPPMWEQYSRVPYPPPGKGQVNLAPVMVGSEGTLAVFRQAKVRLVPRAKRTVLGVLNFNSVSGACDATPELLKLGPSAVELIPRAMIHLARSVPAYANRLSFVKGDPAALLVVEFSAEEQTELDSKLKLLGPNAVLAREAREQEEIWAVRKVALGLLMSRPGDSKPLPFIEDVAVPLEHLGNFVRGLERIFAEHGTSGDFYAHASAGCLHVRPMINLKTLQGVKQMRSITEEVVWLANSFGGAMSGEHGDGLSHSEWLEATFGSELIMAFRQLKQAADPKGILNPGKILDAQRMDENLRYGPDYVSSTWQPVLDFSGQGGFAGAIEMCNGAGVCRKDHGVMCPSFQATREEMHSTRGRANLLRAMISSQGAARDATEKLAYAALDLCLECKGCKAECPSAVDVAKLKYEFLNRYYQSHRRPLRDYAFAHVDKLARIARRVAPLANFVLGNSLSLRLAETALGFSAKRGLPKVRTASPSSVTDGQSGRVDALFLNDAFSEYFYPEVKQAALRVLDAAGVAVKILPILGAGRPFISKGMLSQAKRHASQLLEAVERYDPEGRLPVLGVEPSEIYAVRDEYVDLFPRDARFAALAQRATMVEEFLLKAANGQKSPIQQLRASLGAQSGQVLLHGHCYQKAQPPAADGRPTGQQASAELLSALGWQVEIIDSGCCGMAGSFGYEAEHYDLSIQIGELALFPAVRGASEEKRIVAPGVSCRTQIASGTGREALHPLALIASQLT